MSVTSAMLNSAIVLTIVLHALAQGVAFQPLHGKVINAHR